MKDAQPVAAAPRDAALEICAALRRSSWLSYRRWWCWGCATFSKGDAARMCGAIVACPQVLERYGKRPQAAG